MMLDFRNPELSTEDRIKIIRSGIKKTMNPKKIIIAGAGIAGLLSGYLLKKAGHDVTIIEATDRVGGRIMTRRDNFKEDQYFEAGAMRVPEVHQLTLELIKKFDLPTNEFINIALNNVLFIRNIKTRARIYERHPDMFGFPVHLHERGKTAYELAIGSLQPLIDMTDQNPEEAWPWILRNMDKYSLDGYFRYNPFGLTLSDGAIDMIKAVLHVEGNIHLSVIEQLRELTTIQNPKMDFFEITGGMDRLPNAFLVSLEENIRYGREIKKVFQDENQVTFFGIDDNQENFEITGDLAIITIPFTVLQFVSLEPYEAFSENKRKAIRELKYIAGTKTGIQFKTRFWEKYGIRGGKSTTDLPIKYSHYPSFGIGTDKPGVVIGSYTWEDDAMPWDSMEIEDRVHETLENLSRIFGEQVHSEFLVGDSFSWVRFPYSAGAYAMLRPEQFTQLYPYTYTPEGRVHFAGEHTSSAHGWLQGAIESAIDVALEVNNIS